MVIPLLNSCKTIAVDFDGTLYDHSTNQPYENGPESLKWFRRWGYDIVVFSARAVTKDSIEWMTRFLNDNRIVFDRITNVKPPQVTWIIDDRGITFNNQANNWLEITAAIKQETFPWKQQKSSEE